VSNEEGDRQGVAWGFKDELGGACSTKLLDPGLDIILTGNILFLPRQGRGDSGSYGEISDEEQSNLYKEAG
jgi:hypothetical protein